MNARIVTENGIKKVEINGKRHIFVGYRSWRPQEKYLQAFDELGIPFMTLLPSGIKNSHRVPYSAFGEYWQGDGIYDWEILRKQIDQFTENAPHTYLAINLMLDTRDWFLKEHPECLNSFVYISAACAYPAWRECASRMLRDTIDFLEREYPERVFAFFLSAGGTCEWHNKALDLPENAVRDAHFKRYSSLRDAHLPDQSELEEAADGVFRNMVTQRNVIEFLKYTNEVIVKELAYYAGLVKEHTEGRLLVGAPVGYIMAGEHPLGGYCETAKMLKIPDIDIIVCPASYYHRSLDGVSASQSSMDAVRMNGKLMVHSIDNTTYAANSNPYAQMLQNLHCKHDSMQESIHYIRRETAMAMSKGAGFWFFDMYSGWYPDPESRAELKKIQQVYEKMCEKPVHYQSEVALVTDCRSYLYPNAGKLIRTENITDQVRELGRIGCPVDYLSVYDLLLEDFPAEQYKLLLLPDCFAPDDNIRRVIAELRECGTSLLFYHAAGAVTEHGFDYKAASDFCGITLATDPEEPGFTVVDGKFNSLGYPKIYGDPRKGKLPPGILAQDPDAEVWGKDIFSESARLVVKERKKGFDAWSYRGTIPQCVLQKIAEKAGVFCYQTHGLPTYANSRMAAFFDHKGGTREITFPYRGKLTECYTGQEIISDGTPVQITFAENECKLFLYDDNDKR